MAHPSGGGLGKPFGRGEVSVSQAQRAVIPRERILTEFHSL